MMTQDDFVIIEPIIEKMVHMIAVENNMPILKAMDQFYHSQTYDMLIDPALYVWDFSDKAVYDMWLCEQRTGNPRTSVYIAGDVENER